MRTIIAMLLCLIAGCANLGPTSEQIKAMENTSSSFCFKSPGWNGSSVEAHYTSFGGKATGTTGGGGEAICGNSSAKFNNEGKSANGTPTKGANP